MTFFFLVLTVVCCFFPRIGFASSFTVTPYLQNVTESSIDICFQSERRLPAMILYGGSPDCPDHVDVEGEPFTGLWGFLHPLPLYVPAERYIYCARIDDLEENSTYYYKVSLGGEETPVESFRLAPGPDTDFLFAVYGDTRSDFWLGNLGRPNQYHQRVMEAIGSRNPDFILHTGDLIHDGYDLRLWEIWFGITGSVLDHTPLFPVIGNHEDRTHMDVDGRSLFETIFSNPESSSGRETYYSFNYGNCHFTVVTTEEDYSEGSLQDQWIREDLEQASQDATIDFKFLSYHRPGVTSSFLWEGDEGEHKAREYLVPLAEQYGVDIVFNGHEHCYERSFKDGVYYITSGNGGALPTFFGISENTRLFLLIHGSYVAFSGSRFP